MVGRHKKIIDWLRVQFLRDQGKSYETIAKVLVAEGTPVSSMTLRRHFTILNPPKLAVNEALSNDTSS